mmetsp:Transcript_6522/g.12896  ORF Transcript_6522/g.12896 Transcript_6522/m.12896 type:complete len:280 (-) Transcript_6522:2619-3458(-)
MEARSSTLVNRVFIAPMSRHRFGVRTHPRAPSGAPRRPIALLVSNATKPADKPSSALRANIAHWDNLMQCLAQPTSRARRVSRSSPVRRGSTALPERSSVPCARKEATAPSLHCAYLARMARIARRVPLPTPRVLRAHTVRHPANRSSAHPASTVQWEPQPRDRVRREISAHSQTRWNRARMMAATAPRARSPSVSAPSGTTARRAPRRSAAPTELSRGGPGSRRATFVRRTTSATPSLRRRVPPTPSLRVDHIWYPSVCAERTTLEKSTRGTTRAERS